MKKRNEAKASIKILEDAISEKKNRVSEIEKKIAELTQELSEFAFSEPSLREEFDASEGKERNQHRNCKDRGCKNRRFDGPDCGQNLKTLKKRSGK